MDAANAGECQCLTMFGYMGKSEKEVKPKKQRAEIVVVKSYAHLEAGKWKKHTRTQAHTRCLHKGSASKHIWLMWNRRRRRIKIDGIHQSQPGALGQMKVSC